MNSTARSVAHFLRVAWLPSVLVAAWWFSTAGSTSIYFPPLQKILSTFAHDWFSARVTADLVPSLRNLVLGFFLASVFGVALGLLFGSVRWVAAATEPLVHFVRSLPPPVLLPFALLLLGTGMSMKVSVIAVGAMWPTVLNAMDGVRGVDPELRAMATAYRLTSWQRVRYVILPASGPQIMAGLRTTLQISIILIVVSEMIASTNGIGYYVISSQQTFAVPETWAGTLLLGLIGFISNLLFVRVERQVLRWRAGIRAMAESH